MIDFREIYIAELKAVGFSASDAEEIAAWYLGAPGTTPFPAHCRRVALAASGYDPSQPRNADGEWTSGGGSSRAPSETTEQKSGTGYTSEHRAKIGQYGTYQSLGLPAMRDLAPDPVIVKNGIAEATRRVNDGIKVSTPLGAEVTVDSSTLKHWRKAKHPEKDIQERLQHLDGALETLKHPHEIWHDPAGKKNLYVRITELAPGRKVVNAVEDLRPSEGYVSWHVNAERYDYYRKGKLLWLR